MKSVHLLLLVLLSSLFVLMLSCNGKNDDYDLCGVWTLVSVQTPSDSLIDENEEGKIEGHVLYVLNQDSTYQISDAGYTVSGNWSYSEGTISFFPSDSTAQGESAKLERLSDDTLILSPEPNQEQGEVTENLILVKVKK